MKPLLRPALERLAAADRLLVALDFDGTMSPLVDRAEDARPLPATAEAFARLAELPRTATALLSGRALDSLRLVASPRPGTLLIGSHGAEVWAGPDAEPLQLTAGQQAVKERIIGVLDEVRASHPGTRLEVKPAGVVLHTRTADDGVAAAATETARLRLAAEVPEAHLTDGKRVLETSVVHANKGEGLELLRSLTGATAVLFAGDDVTDERAFEVLRAGDVGIKVGAGNTAAAYSIGGPEELPEILEGLTRMRQLIL